MEGEKTMAREWESPRVKRDREERAAYRKERGLKLEPYATDEDGEERKRMSPEEYEKVLTDVLEANGDTTVLTEKLDALRESYRGYDERMRRYEDSYDRLYDRYEDLRQKNLDLFYRAASTRAMELQDEDIKEDGETLTFDQLFEKREEY
jgi:hypothetical protein